MNSNVALEVISLCLQNANNFKLNNMMLVSIPRCRLCVDSHRTANSPAAVTPILLSWSPVAASVLAFLARLGTVKCREAYHTNSAFPFKYVYLQF